MSVTLTKVNKLYVILAQCIYSSKKKQTESFEEQSLFTGLLFISFLRHYYSKKANAFTKRKELHNTIFKSQGAAVTAKNDSF